MRHRIPAITLKRISNPKTLPTLFLVISQFFGTTLVFLTPPFQVTDEFWHFFRAYQVSQGRFIAEKQGDTQGGMLPASLLDLSSRFAQLPYHPRQKTSVHEILDAGQIPLAPQRTVFCRFPSSANYSPLIYLPQAIGIGVGRLLGLNPLALLYFGREANLLFYSVAGYFTLSLAPAFKRAVLIVMLMPMSLSLAASVSGDAMTIAICLLFTALAWHCRVASKITFRKAAGIMALSVAVTLCKFAYAPLILLVLLIPSSRFGGKERHIKFIIALIAMNLIVSLAWVSQTAGASLVLRPDRPDVNARQQLAFVRSHPLSILPALARGIAGDGPLLLQSFVGYLGWLDTPASPIVVVVYWLAIIGACRPAVDDPPAPAKRDLLLLTMIFLSCTAIFAFLNYLVWTPVGALKLQGLQGRYFIPLGAVLPMLIWGMMRRFPRMIRPTKKSPALDIVIAALCICGCFYTLFLVFTRYFIAG